MQTRSDRWALGLILTACLGMGLWATERLWPRTLPYAEHIMLPCVSYAPFRNPAHSPFDPGFRIDRESLREDLAKIRSISTCLRTYGIDQGMEQLPELAREMGLRLQLGLWLGQDSVANRRGIEQAVALTRAYPEVIDQLIVGNEVLLRGDLAPDALADILAEMQRRIDLPISYADVWAFWRRHAEVLLPHVDRVTVHILPYWEDEPIAVGEAVGYVYSRYAEMRDLFAPLPVWVGETGWPARGRDRGPAAPGAQEQAIFVHGLLARHQSEPIPFNLIESFDQPWKRIQEGAMGGAWGVFDAAGQRRLDWRQPRSAGLEKAAVVCIWGLFGVGLLLLWREGRSRERPSYERRTGWAWFLLLFVSGLLAVQLQWAQTWSRSTGEWVVAFVEMGLALLLSIALVDQILCRRSGGHRRPHAGPTLLRFLLGLWLAAVLIDVYGLVFDGRYRALAWPLLLGPTVLGAAAAVLGSRGLWQPLPNRLMGLLAGLAGATVIYREGLENSQALSYGALLICLAFLAGLAGRAASDRSDAGGGGHREDQAVKSISGRL